MAFMMPVVRNEYDIYANRSRRSSSASSIPSSRRSTTSQPASLSCSPGSDIEERMASMSLGSSPPVNITMCRKSSSNSSLSKFHTRVVDKIKRRLRNKDDVEIVVDYPSSVPRHIS